MSALDGKTSYYSVFLPTRRSHVFLNIEKREDYGYTNSVDPDQPVLTG